VTIVVSGVDLRARVEKQAHATRPDVALLKKLQLLRLDKTRSLVGQSAHFDVLLMNCLVVSWAFNYVLVEVSSI